jgi:hypothetical protein
MNIEELAKRYDEVIGTLIHKAAAPTAESIKHIEASLGVKLPVTLVNFAKSTTNYGNWLASIGPDFDSPTHILVINQELRDEYRIPKNLVVINVGYDNDYDCMDTETYSSNTGEYLITYWAYDVPQRESELYGSFQEYMHKQIEFWGKNA